MFPQAMLGLRDLFSPTFWRFPRQLVDCYGTLDPHKEVYCRTVAYEGRVGVLLLVSLERSTVAVD